MENLAKSFSLFRVGALIDDDLLGTISICYFTGPPNEHCPVQAIQSSLIEVTFFDVTAHHRLAIPVGGS